MAPDQPPRGSPQNNEGDLPAAQVLLVSNILISRQQNVEPCVLRQSEQISIGDPLPSQFPGLSNLMAAQ